MAEKKKSAMNVPLRPLDNLFEPTIKEEPKATGTNSLSIDNLHAFKRHPFKMYTEERMAEMVESVKEHGVIAPILVRPNKYGDGYEIISGHNRVEACRRAGIKEIPATIRDLDDDTAIILMVDSNLRQRDKLLPTDVEIKGIEEFIKTVKPLDEEIETKICIVPESETTCKRGGQYCILFYSEAKDEYLRNVGYIGEQIDLYLASQNIGALWFGIGKPKNMQMNGFDFVIMISIAKMPVDKFRKDMFKSKRKPPSEMWNGNTLGIAEIVRFTPSACNTQPWIVENTGCNLMVYRFKKPGKRGIMPADKVRYYNKIDMGIFLFMLETCLEHENYTYQRTLFADTTDDSVEQTLIAKYTYLSK